MNIPRTILHSQSKMAEGHHQMILAGQSMLVETVQSMLEILSLFPRSEKIRLFFDISLILSFISGLFIKKNRSLAAILIIEIFLRIFCLLYDSYVNIVPIIGKKSVAADIVIWEWQKYLLGIILFISIITFSFLKSNVFVKTKEKHESDNF